VAQQRGYTQRTDDAHIKQQQSELKAVTITEDIQALTSDDETEPLFGKQNDNHLQVHERTVFAHFERIHCT